MNLDNCASAPEALLDLFDSVSIRSEIAENWGTNYCTRFLDELTADTRNNTRKGFPDKTAGALIELSLLHAAYMKKLGYGDFEDSAFGFSDTKWRLPKNF